MTSCASLLPPPPAIPGPSDARSKPPVHPEGVLSPPQISSISPRVSAFRVPGPRVLQERERARATSGWLLVEGGLLSLGVPSAPSKPGFHLFFGNTLGSHPSVRRPGGSLCPARGEIGTRLRIEFGARAGQRQFRGASWPACSHPSRALAVMMLACANPRLTTRRDAARSTHVFRWRVALCGRPPGAPTRGSVQARGEPGFGFVEALSRLLEGVQTVLASVVAGPDGASRQLSDGADMTLCVRGLLLVNSSQPRRV